MSIRSPIVLGTKQSRGRLLFVLERMDTAKQPASP